MTNAVILLYIWTNAVGVCSFSPSREDAAVSAVGAIVTSAVPPFIAAPAPDPTPMPNGIEAPVVVLTDDNGVGYGVIVDGGDLLTYQDHASPRPSEAVLRQRIQQARADRAALRRDARTVRTNMVNLATTATTAQAQQQQIEELRKAVRDLSAIIRKQLKDPAP